MTYAEACEERRREADLDAKQAKEFGRCGASLSPEDRLIHPGGCLRPLTASDYAGVCRHYPECCQP